MKNEGTMDGMKPVVNHIEIIPTEEDKKARKLWRSANQERRERLRKIGSHNLMVVLGLDAKNSLSLLMMKRNWTATKVVNKLLVDAALHYAK